MCRSDRFYRLRKLTVGLCLSLDVVDVQTVQPFGEVDPVVVVRVTVSG